MPIANNTSKAMMLYYSRSILGCPNPEVYRNSLAKHLELIFHWIP